MGTIVLGTGVPFCGVDRFLRVWDDSAEVKLIVNKQHKEQQ
jgi:hypothetical protein